VTEPDALEHLINDALAGLPRWLLSSFRQVDALEPARTHLEALSRHQPDIVTTYPSVLRNMAALAETEGIVPFQPKVFLVSGEVLDGKTRELVARVFRGEVIDDYASTEGGIIALECPARSGLHVRCGDALLELLRDGEPAPAGVPGTVVVTHLRNRSTPIIRYAGLGDVAVLSEAPCPCGSRLPLLESIEGRLIDSVALPDGRLIHPFSLTQALLPVPGLQQFQVLQETADRLRVLAVARKEPPAAGATGLGGRLRGEVVRNLEAVLGPGIRIDVDLVEEIPARGEVHRPVVRSMLKKDAAGV
jgi:phenylacetate-CoA ligase